MYQAFYSLAKAPFSKENSSFFASRGFSEATARLEYLKKAGGWALWWVNQGLVKLLF